MKAGAPRRARRFLDQQRQEAALGLPQRQRTRQAQQQSGFPACPELDEHRVEARPMDQARPPVRHGLCRGGKLQGARRAGSGGGGCPVAKARRVADFFGWLS